MPKIKKIEKEYEYKIISETGLVKLEILINKLAKERWEPIISHSYLILRRIV